MSDFSSYRQALSLVTSYRAAFPDRAPECHLQELLARGPQWFARWWESASEGTRHSWLRDSGLTP